MNTVQIPTHNLAYFAQDIDIAEQGFVFEFTWNQREQYYQLHIRNFEEKPIVLGLKLLPNWPLLRRNRRGFPGELILLSDKHDKPSPTNLDQFQLVCHASF